MAKAPAAATQNAAADKSKKSDGSGNGFIIALVILTLLGGGGGFVFGMQVLKPAEHAQAAASESEAEVPDAGKDKHDAHGASEKKSEKKLSGKLVPIPAIVTNLLEPSDVFIRIEGSVLVDADFSEDASLAAKISEDVLALLKTLTLARLQGASGLSHLREDINDRVKVRSENKARELIINTLVIE